MTNTTQPGAPPPTEADAKKAAKQAAMQKITRWVVPIALIISGGGGLIKFLTPVLPSCASSNTCDSLKNIFKSKDVEVSKRDQFKTVTDTSDEKTCQAHVETPSENALIDYRIYWQGKDGQIIITKVDSTPK
jgi:hypothetical protein